MYRIIRFGTTELEYYNQVDSIGSGATPVNYINLLDGGALDGFGVTQKHPGTVERSKTMRLTGSSEAAVEALYFGLLALRGKRDKLYRRTSQGDIHWMYARCIEVTAERSYELTRFKVIQDVTLRFISQEATWRGAEVTPWLLDAGYLLDTGLHLNAGEVHELTASPVSFGVVIGSSSDYGRAPVKAVVITVSAGDAELSNITIARTSGETLVYTGAIPAAGTLVIDCGALTVTCTGVTNAYNNLTVTPIAGNSNWFTLDPSPATNAMIITYTGGGTGKQIEFEFYEAWY